MTEATDILRSYVRLVERLSGAASVSLYVPPARQRRARDPPARGPAAAGLRAGGRGGRGPPAAARAHDDVPGGPKAARCGWRAGSAGGVLYRIPLGWVLDGPKEDAGRAGPPQPRGPRAPGGADGLDRPAVRRRRGGRGATDCRDFADRRRDSWATSRWWKSFLGLAAAFAAHARTVSRTLFDQVTGLPQRPEFQSQLDMALAQTRGAQAAGGAHPARAGQLRLGERAPRPPLRRPRPGGDRRRGPGRPPQPRPRRPLRRGDVRRHPLRHRAPTWAARSAENLVRRLDQQRYHGGLLRLEFGAGLAVADGGEAIDATR